MAIAEELAALRERTLAEIAAADTSAALEAVRVAVLGKSGTLTLGENVDAISGATISSRAVLAGVKEAQEILKSHIEPGGDAT